MRISVPCGAFRTKALPQDDVDCILDRLLFCIELLSTVEQEIRATVVIRSESRALCARIDALGLEVQNMIVCCLEVQCEDPTAHA